MCEQPKLPVDLDLTGLHVDQNGWTAMVGIFGSSGIILPPHTHI